MKTTCEYSTPTLPGALFASLSDRVDEFNATERDRRAMIRLRNADPDAGTFSLVVREGAVPEASLDLSVTLTPRDDGGTDLSGTLRHDPADGEATFSRRLYGLFLSGFARLSLLALFYGILLGVSFLFPGRNFWVPAIPPVFVFVLMTVRACLVRRRLPERIKRFFTDFCGCTAE